MTPPSGSSSAGQFGITDVHATGLPSNPAADVLAQGKAVQATVAATNHPADGDSFVRPARVTVLPYAYTVGPPTP